jgi:hypothetical protein
MDELGPERPQIIRRRLRMDEVAAIAARGFGDMVKAGSTSAEE